MSGQSACRAQSRCLMCGSTHFSLWFVYQAPPEGETRFELPDNTPYKRKIWQCNLCGHFVNRHQMDLPHFYEKDYVDATYGTGGMLKAFQRIMGLPPELSDNHHRVQRVLSFMSDYWPKNKELCSERPTLLDVGAGLSVFAAKMRLNGWDCTVLDPDPRAIAHARDNVKVHTICGDFVGLDDIGSYALITFNKVLEHVEDPITMLSECRRHLKPHGAVYVEVPDGEAAAEDGPHREEFFLEHWHVFSVTSVSLLASKAGFVTQLIERVREPSSKYTLRAFLAPPAGSL